MRMLGEVSYCGFTAVSKLSVTYFRQSCQRKIFNFHIVVKVALAVVLVAIGGKGNRSPAAVV